MKTKILVVFAGLMLGGCATQNVVSTGPSPTEIRAGGITHGEVHWGGQVVKVDNQRDRTLVEVLALPLASDGKPQTDLRPQGRFIVEKSGFLEPYEYQAGSLVEVRGQLNGFVDGEVGDSAYRYPLVVSERLRLWSSPARDGSSGPSVRPSIGIGIGSGSGTWGGSWGGMGIGIGF